MAVAKNKQKSSGLDKLIAGIASLIAIPVCLMVISFFTRSPSYGAIFTVILVVIITWKLTLIILASDPDAEERAEKQNQWAIQEKEKLQNFRSELTSYTEGDIFTARYLGGSGNNFDKNSEIIVGQGNDGIYLGDIHKKEHKNIAIKDVTLFEISGEGTVTTNAGVVGGGFGVEGFIKGAVVAEIVNKATSKTTTNTFLRIMTSESELYFHTSEKEPAQLQILFSKVFVHINSLKNTKANVTGISDELVKLHSLLKDGVLTQAEFETAKRNLLEG